MAIKGNIPDIGKAYILKVGKDLEAEVENRKAADDALSEKLDKEIADRKEGDSALSDKLNQEAQTRKAADDELRRAIEAEQKLRQDADNELKNDLGDLSDRVDSVEGNITNLGDRVTNLENNTGGGSGGSIAVDATLTKEGEAADAKAVGDELQKVEELRLRGCKLRIPLESVYSRKDYDAYINYRILLGNISELMPDGLKDASQIIHIRDLYFAHGSTGGVAVNDIPYTWAVGNYDGAINIYVLITEGAFGYEMLDYPGLNMCLDVVYAAYPISR